MTINLIVNGVSYAYPVVGDEEWGAEATAWAKGVTDSCLQKSGGLFQLGAEVDFGANFGLRSIYYKSRSTPVATTGQLRLANLDQICFRNAADDGDICISLNGDSIEFDGDGFVTLTGTQTLTNKTLTSPVIDTPTVNGGTLTGGSPTLTIDQAVLTNVVSVTGIGIDDLDDATLTGDAVGNILQNVGGIYTPVTPATVGGSISMDDLVDTDFGSPKVDGYVVTWVGSPESGAAFKLTPSGGGGGASRFRDLTDTPADYTAASGKFVQVAGGSPPNQLIFTDIGDAGVLALDDLSDVTLGSPITADDVLAWDGTNLRWEDTTPVIAAIDELANVTISTPVAGQVLTYQGSPEVWANTAAPASSLTDLTDVTITSPSENQVLLYGGSPETWYNGTAPIPSIALNDLSDVDVAGVTENQVLKYTGSPLGWVAAAEAGGANELDDLSDVTITAPSAGNILVYGPGSPEQWENQTPQQSIFNGKLWPTSGGTDGQFLTVGSPETTLKWTSSTIAYVDVDTSGSPSTVPSATGTNAVAIGPDVIVANDYGVGIGGDINIAGGNDSIAIGHSAATSGVDAIAIGGVASALTQSVALGAGARNNNFGSATAVGQGAETGGTGAVSVGFSATATGLDSVAIGRSAEVDSNSNNNAIAIGRSARS